MTTNRYGQKAILWLGGSPAYFPDNGCEISKSCFECPLPQCIFELSGPEQIRFKTAIKHQKLIDFCEQNPNLPQYQIAAKFKISERQLSRIIKNRNLNNG